MATFFCLFVDNHCPDYSWEKHNKPLATEVPVLQSKHDLNRKHLKYLQSNYFRDLFDCLTIWAHLWKVWNLWIITHYSIYQQWYITWINYADYRYFLFHCLVLLFILSLCDLSYLKIICHLVIESLTLVQLKVLFLVVTITVSVVCVLKDGVNVCLHVCAIYVFLVCQLHFSSGKQIMYYNNYMYYLLAGPSRHIGGIDNHLYHLTKAGTNCQPVFRKCMQIFIEICKQ